MKTKVKTIMLVIFALVGITTIAATIIPSGTAESIETTSTSCAPSGGPCYGGCGVESCGAANGGACDCESCPALNCRDGNCGGSCSDPTCGAKVGKSCGCGQ